jgi:DNA polymerase I-like protein with 3'-5' exonuclease and polymerase domains
VFAWLYNPKARNKKLQQFLNKDNILHEYYNGHSVETPFNRSIEVAEEKALNYLIQSTTSDLFLTQAIKVFNILSDSDSHIAFCIHDSLVIDMSRSDQHLMQEIMSLFSDTSFGHFKTNISIGKDYGSMRKVQ